jgi:hypothetical protein
MAERDDELQAASWLRARSFYAYPPERAFAGEVRFRPPARPPAALL